MLCGMWVKIFEVCHNIVTKVSVFSKLLGGINMTQSCVWFSRSVSLCLIWSENHFSFNFSLTNFLYRYFENRFALSLSLEV